MDYGLWTMDGWEGWSDGLRGVKEGPEAFQTSEPRSLSHSLTAAPLLLRFMADDLRGAGSYHSTSHPTEGFSRRQDATLCRSWRVEKMHRILPSDV